MLSSSLAPYLKFSFSFLVSSDNNRQLPRLSNTILTPRNRLSLPYRSHSLNHRVLLLAHQHQLPFLSYQKSQPSPRRPLVSHLLNLPRRPPLLPPSLAHLLSLHLLSILNLPNLCLHLHLHLLLLLLLLPPFPPPPQPRLAPPPFQTSSPITNQPLLHLPLPSYSLPLLPPLPFH